MGRTKQAVQETRLRLTFDRASETTLCLEPWGDVHSIAPGDTVDVVASGPGGDSLELEIRDGQVTVWVWSGATVRAFVNGTELGPADAPRPPVPPVPVGTTARTLVNGLFGPAAEPPRQAIRRPTKANASA
jgi:hypothetical protein